MNRAISGFQWDFHLNKLPNPNSQVKFLNKIILNIITNFVPSSSIMSNIREPKWVTRYIKNLLRKQEKFYKKYRLNGFKADDKVIVDRMREECFQAIKTSKENYLKSLGMVANKKIRELSRGFQGFFRPISKGISGVINNFQDDQSEKKFL